MRRSIPNSLLAICAEIAARRETHATLDNLFTYAGASGEPPPGSKPAKALAWLRCTNKDDDLNPLDILGRIIENYMEEILDGESDWDAHKIKDREKISQTLAQCELQYVKGGKIVGSLGVPSRTLEQQLKEHDLVSVENEFNRALKNVETSPREAVSAAGNILESLCKIYIEDNNLAKPSKLDLKSVWAVVKKDLGFDPGSIEDQDLQKILTGLFSIIDGVASLRSHGSSAHGEGKKSYKLEPRHARLAIHAAHTATLFILETWQKKEKFSLHNQ